MEEMMNDTLDSGVFGEDQEELEEEAQEEVSNVLHELTDGAYFTAHTGKLGEAKPASELPSLSTEPTTAHADDNQDLEQMQAQLDGLLRG